MEIKEGTLEGLIKTGTNFFLIVGDKRYLLKDVLIRKISNPVTRPTTIGGSYFSDFFAYKLKGKLDDISLIPFLTKTMLGPNQEFKKLEIEVKTVSMKNILERIFTHLTSIVQTKSKIELDMEIVGTS